MDLLKKLDDSDIKMWELINASTFLADHEKRKLLEKLLGRTLDVLVSQK